jgi:MFS family permease
MGFSTYRGCDLAFAATTASVNSVVSDESSLAERTISKVKIRLLPWLFLLFLVNYIDRINIGFAALTMNRELGLTAQQFGFAAGIFFSGYVIFEVPSNLMLHKIGARIWMARILLSWGILASAAGLIHSLHQLYWVRFLLGLAEAGYFPGIVLYLGYWFAEKERSKAIALFMAAMPVASIVGAPISGLILDNVHWLGVSSWRWLLILEGLPAIACGFLTLILLPSWPSEAEFLAPREKEWLCGAMAKEEGHRLQHHSYSIREALLHGRIWHLGAIEFCMALGFYTLLFWAPQLMKAAWPMYSNAQVGLLVMIPHLLGIGSMILVSRSSDRTLERRFHAAIPVGLGGIALLLLGQFHGPIAEVGLMSVLAIGLYGFMGPFFALPGAFLSGYAAAAGIALMNSVANVGGFLGPYAVGVMSTWAGGIYKGVALLGIPLLCSSALLVLLPKQAGTKRPAVDKQAILHFPRSR